MDNGDFLSAADPLVFAKLLWPKVAFWGKQREIIYSVRDNKYTVVASAHKMGKDFVAAFIVLWYFLVHSPCRIVTTTVSAKHIAILWDEMDRFIRTARYPLTTDKGGPLLVNHWHLRKIVNGEIESLSYVKGMTVGDPEALSGHYAANTLFVVDEASGVKDWVFDRGDGWAKRQLIFGNPYPADNNYFERAVREGDLE